MQSITRLPIFAHWRGHEFAVELPESQPTPDVGSIIYLSIDLNGSYVRVPFRVTHMRRRTDADGSRGLLRRFRLRGGGLPTAIDLDVEPNSLDD